MADASEYFARIAQSVNLPLLQSKLVVVVGVGTVGSQMTRELAKCGVARFILIDGDHLEESNRIRHVLPEGYIGTNKAEAMAFYLTNEVPGISSRAVPRDVDGSMSDSELDILLENADLIVAATDDREAQRRVGRRALSLTVPAIFPALYGDEGGEVIVQLDPRAPCFFCWDGFRNNAERLRGVTALNMTILPTIYTAIRLSLGILDPRSEYRQMMMRGSGQLPNQVFQLNGLGTLNMAPLIRRHNCPSCAVGPAPVRQNTTSGGTPSSPDAEPDLQQPISIRIIALCISVAIVVLIAVVSHKAGEASPPTPESPPTLDLAEQTPHPLPEPVERIAEEEFGVTPSWSDAIINGAVTPEVTGTTTEDSYIASAQLNGFLLEVQVAIAYSPAGARIALASAGSTSLKDVVGTTTCIELSPTVDSKFHESKIYYSLIPIESHLTQRGLEVKGTLVYPAVFPGTFTWGCGRGRPGSSLGVVFTANLGVFQHFVVYTANRGLTETIIFFGAADFLSGENKSLLPEVFIRPTADTTYNVHIYPTQIHIYRQWPAGIQGPYAIGTLTFPIGNKSIEKDSLYYAENEAGPGIELHEPR
jgi:ThiF family